jgi:hypothetical protein
LRAANQNLMILVAQIIPVDPMATSCPDSPPLLAEVNRAIVAWAAANSTPTSPTRVVDQFGGRDALADDRDAVHPSNGTGSQKTADKWYAALAPLF